MFYKKYLIKFNEINIDSDDLDVNISLLQFKKYSCNTFTIH